MMILQQDSELSKDGILIFSVKSGEEVLCPCCGSLMKYYDHCKRTYFDAKNFNQKQKIKIPRYKCTNEECLHKYSRILPLGLLLPYVRYTADTIEDEIDNIIETEQPTQENNAAEAEESTIRNWKKRFMQFAGYMNAAVIRYRVILETEMELKQNIIAGFRELAIYRSLHPKGWLSKIASQTVEILMCGFHSVCNACQ